MLKPVLRQNFTINPNVLDDVTNALKIENLDKIVEVGPGKGILTIDILKDFGKKNNIKSEDKADNTEKSFLLSYEVDEDLREDLNYIKRKYKETFDYRIQSFLDAKSKSGFNKCTGNIPYHISEPLFFKLIEWDFDLIVFITGIKFAKKVTGQYSGKIATIAKYLFINEIVKEYDKNIFYPKSKVDSALLVMRKRTSYDSPIDEKIAQVMKNIFKKDLWLNKFLGFEQSQKGQIYHMDLEKLVEEIRVEVKN